MHRDLVRNHWLEGYQTLIRRFEPDDPGIEELGAQVRSGWATYVNLTEAHSEEACPFRSTDRVYLKRP